MIDITDLSLAELLESGHRTVLADVLERFLRDDEEPSTISAFNSAL